MRIWDSGERNVWNPKDLGKPLLQRSLGKLLEFTSIGLVGLYLRQKMVEILEMTEALPPYVYRFCKCETCGREILVEYILMGVDHTIDILVSCKECLKKKNLDKEFSKQHPSEAKAIKKWLEE